MDLFEELERLADTTTSTNDSAIPSPTTIQSWMTLFDLTHSQATSLIIAQSEDFSSPNRLSTLQWELIREEKQALGFDKSSYEHSLELLRKGNAKTTSGATVGKGPSVRESGYSYLMKLEAPLESAEKVRIAARMDELPEAVEDEEKTASFCRVTGLEKWKIGCWVEEDARGFVPTFTRIVMPARKKLEEGSMYPMLGVDSTLPQFRGEVVGPKQEEWPVWYFFYGTLGDREVLERLLSMGEEEMVLREGSVVGGVLKTWGGKYRAMVDGSGTDKVVGKAFLVTSKEHEDAPRQYETENYEVVRCTISMEGGEKVEGCTFRFIGDVD